MGAVGAARAGGTTRTESAEERKSKFQKFRGDPRKSDGWSFTGNEWTEKWFEKNSSTSTQIEQMTEDERFAFRSWSHGMFMSGQQYKAFSDMSRQEQDYTRIFDKYLDNSELKEGIITYRRAGYELINNGSRRAISIDKLKGMVGDIVTSKGSMSTAAASSGLWGMGGSAKPVEYVFRIPAGKGAGMWIGDKRINSWGSEQREYMTNRDASFRIVSVKENSGSTTRGSVQVVLEYIGHSKHDYS